jgi:hypothetical protein
MNASSIAALTLAAAAMLALAVALGVLWRAARRAGVRLETLHAQVTRLLEAQPSLDARLEALAALVREERAFAPSRPAASGRAYELAAHLASSGVGAEQLVAQCGLTPAEAEIAVRIHGLRAKARVA